jgi:hypothetical protein
MRPLAGAALLLAAACARGDAGPDAAERALAWLWSQQDDSGLIRSTTYGVLRRGESLTAAAVLATALHPERRRAPHLPALARALRALTAARERPPRDEPVDYPCYTLAAHLHALMLLRPPAFRSEAERLVARLRAVQCNEANGWSRADAVFGGFGLGDQEPQKPTGAELVTLSVTAGVLEALAAAGVAASDPMVTDARVFVDRCQHFGDAADGGFCAAPTGDARGAKGGVDAGGRPRSYGTATADGLAALLAAGEPASAPRVRAAAQWLETNATIAVPGLGPDFEPSLRVYWAAALARARRAAGLAVGPDPSSIVLPLQAADGSFAGLGRAMKEDDPVVATVLALVALAQRRRRSSP